ncbi:MAG: permease [Candidatus Aminicenantia bacterium]
MKNSGMLTATLIMAILALVSTFFVFKRGQGEHIKGLTTAGKMIVQILPLLIFALILASMIQILMPKELILRWVGQESGIRGILIGSIAGGLMPGGPYVAFPIAAGLLKIGASIPTMVAFLTGWSLYALSRLPLEVGLIGYKFVLIRLACTLLFPPLAGLISLLIFSKFLHF